MKRNSSDQTKKIMEKNTPKVDVIVRNIGFIILQYSPVADPLCKKRIQRAPSECYNYYEQCVASILIIIIIVQWLILGL